MKRLFQYFSFCTLLIFSTFLSPSVHAQDDKFEIETEPATCESSKDGKIIVTINLNIIDKVEDFTVHLENVEEGGPKIKGVGDVIGNRLSGRKLITEFSPLAAGEYIVSINIPSSDQCEIKEKVEVETSEDFDVAVLNTPSTQTYCAGEQPSMSFGLEIIGCAEGDCVVKLVDCEGKDCSEVTANAENTIELAYKPHKTYEINVTPTDNRVTYKVVASKPNDNNTYCTNSQAFTIGFRELECDEEGNPTMFGGVGGGGGEDGENGGGGVAGGNGGGEDGEDGGVAGGNGDGQGGGRRPFCFFGLCIPNPFPFEIPIWWPFDPNDIIGPDGVGARKWITKEATLPYKIRFENDPDLATTSALKVIIRQQLDPSVDVFAFRLGSFGFGPYTFDIPENSMFHTTQLDVSDSLGVVVNLVAGIDVIKREAFWIFESKDPITGLDPTDAALGFLLVNDSLGNGEGFVNYTIKAHPESVTGDTIYAEASIVFDENEAIITPEIFNTIDALPPTSTFEGLGDLVSTRQAIRVVAQDDEGGSGWRDYDLFISADGGNVYTPLAVALPKDSVYEFIGAPGQSYCLYATAWDSAGNQEIEQRNTVCFTVADGPYLSLLELDANATFCARDTIAINWSSANVDSVNLEYSIDGGANYQLLEKVASSTNSGYQWATPDDLIAGDYLIRIIDHARDTIFDESSAIAISNLPALNILAPDTALCVGETVTLDAGSGYDRYDWSNGSVSQEVTVSRADTLVLNVYNEAGCVRSDRVIIEELPLPIVSFTLATEDSVCYDAPTISLSGGMPLGGSYSGIAVDGAGNFVPSNADVFGGYSESEITYSYTDTNGCTDTAMQILTVFEQPELYHSPLDPVTSTTPSFTLSGASPAGGVYSGLGVSSDSIFDPSVAGEGIHQITYSYTMEGLNCSNSIIIPIQVTNQSKMLELSIVNMQNAYCEGSFVHITWGALNIATIDIELSQDGGANYQSIAQNVNVDLGFYSWEIPTGYAAISNLIRISDATDNTIQDETDVAFAIHSATVPSIATPQGTALCAGDSLFLDAGAGFINYQWIGGVSNSQTLTVYDSGEYRVIVENSHGCLAEDSVEITLKPAPVISFAALDSLCENALPIALSGGMPLGGTYAGIGVDEAGNFDPSVAGAGTHELIYEYTAANGCTDTAKQFIEVNPLPFVSLYVGPAVNIDDTAFTLSGGFPNGGTYTGVGVVNDSVFNPALAGHGKHQITYTFTDTLGCTNSIVDSITVDRLKLMAPNGGESYCIGDTITIDWEDGTLISRIDIDVSLDSGATYESIADFVATSTDKYNWVVPSSKTGSILIRISSNADSTIYDISETYFTVNAKPAVSLAGLPSVCINNPAFTLSGGFPSGGMYSGIGVAEDTLFNPSVAGFGSHSITYIYTDSNGCTNTDSRFILVDSMISASLAALPVDEVCENEAKIELTGGLPLGGTYSGNGVDAFGDFNPSEAGPGIHQITYTFGRVCKDSASKSITVKPAPMVSLAPFDDVYEGDAAFALAGGLPLGGTYSGNGVDSLGNFDPVIAGVRTHQISYSYTDANGCTSTASQILNVLSTFVELNLTELHADEPCLSRNWEVTNPNVVDVNYTWEVLGTSIQGEGIAAPGQSSLLTPAIPGENTVKISWVNPQGLTDSNTQTSSASCPTSLISITNPANGDELSMDMLINVDVALTIDVALIDSIVLMSDNVSKGVMTGGATSLQTSWGAEGNYSLKAVAYLSSGAISESQPITVSVIQNIFSGLFDMAGCDSIVVDPLFYAELGSDGEIRLDTICYQVVEIIKPSDGDLVPLNELVDIEITAYTTMGSIDSVALYSDGNKVGTVSALPYTISTSWTTAGAHTLQAKAYGSNGLVSSSSLITVIADQHVKGHVFDITGCDSVIIDPYFSAEMGSDGEIRLNNTLCDPIPEYTVSISTPLDSQSLGINRAFDITVEASASIGTVDSVEVYSNGVKLGTFTAMPYTLSYSWTTVGNYSLRAKAYFSSGISMFSEAVTVLVDENYHYNTFDISGCDSVEVDPAFYAALGSEGDIRLRGSCLDLVRITNPQDGNYYKVDEMLTITVEASSAQGSIDSVEVFASGTKLTVLTAAPYTFQTSWATEGEYQLYAVAHNSLGESNTSDIVTVFLENDIYTSTFDISGCDSVEVGPYFDANLGSTGDIRLNPSLCATEVYSISITNPLDSQLIGLNQSVEIAVDASTTAGTIDSVEVFSNHVKLGVLTTAPYNLMASWGSEGRHTIHAIAHISTGIALTSELITVWVDENYYHGTFDVVGCDSVEVDPVFFASLGSFGEIRLDPSSCAPVYRTVADKEDELSIEEPLVSHHLDVFPNPFNQGLTIRYELGADQHVAVYIYDVAGNLISSLMEKQWKTKGTHELKFDGTRLASGVYLVRMVMENNKQKTVRAIKIEK
ncbi:MAG: Ig-like domain-containing protein [Flammeovirgaceae bacterium]